MMGLRKIHPPAQFEISVISRWALANPSGTKFEVATFIRCKNINGELQKFWGAFLAHCHAYFFSWCDFIMAFGKPKFEVASLSCGRNI